MNFQTKSKCAISTPEIALLHWCFEQAIGTGQFTQLHNNPRCSFSVLRITSLIAMPTLNSWHESQFQVLLKKFVECPYD